MFEHTRLIHTCTRCGASWEAPRDQPHDCVVKKYREALEWVAERSPNPLVAAHAREVLLDLSSKPTNESEPSDG